MGGVWCLWQKDSSILLKNIISAVYVITKMGKFVPHLHFRRTENAFSFMGASPRPHDHGLCPWTCWGLCPHTLVIGSRSALATSLPHFYDEVYVYAVRKYCELGGQFGGSTKSVTFVYKNSTMHFNLCDCTLSWNCCLTTNRSLGHHRHCLL